MTAALLSLETVLPAEFLAEQAANTVGPSRSYLYGGHQWGLATDAAGHVSAYRPDLVEEIGGFPSPGRMCWPRRHGQERGTGAPSAHSHRCHHERALALRRCWRACLPAG